MGQHKILKHVSKTDYIEKKFLGNKGYFTRAEVLQILKDNLPIGEIIQKEQEDYRNYKTFKDFAKLLFYRQLSNYDSMVLITGLKGVGKSNASIMLAQYYTDFMNHFLNTHPATKDKPHKRIQFQLKRNIGYTREDTYNNIAEFNKFEACIADESLNFISSEDWNKAENKALKKRLGMVRTKHLLFIMNFPNKIKKVDKVYLESYVDYWIHIYAKGQGAIFVRDHNPAHDSWRLNSFIDIGKLDEFTSPRAVIKAFSKHPNFWKAVRIPKLSRVKYDYYVKNIREKGVWKDEDSLDGLAEQDLYALLLALFNHEILVRGSNFTIDEYLKNIKKEYGIELKKNVYANLLSKARGTFKKYGKQKKEKERKQ